jgi:hypothetical protein
MSHFPPTYTPASGDEELERLQELIAEGKELCIEFQIEMYCEAQRSQGKIELLSKELEEMKRASGESGGTAGLSRVLPRKLVTGDNATMPDMKPKKWVDPGAPRWTIDQALQVMTQLNEVFRDNAYCLAMHGSVARQFSLS